MPFHIKRFPALWWYSLYYTRPKQFFFRVWRIFKCHLPRRFFVKPMPAVPRVAVSLPGPLFSPRTCLAEKINGAIQLNFLNSHCLLNIPHDWQQADLPLLARFHLHYMEYLEALDDQAFLGVIQDWIRQNPRNAPGSWRDAWHSYTLSIRCVVWMQQYAARAPGLPVDFRGLMLRSLWEQLNFLSRNLELDLGGNHLVKNIKALIWAGAFFDDDAAHAWRAKGKEMLQGELKEQILKDGMHYERSPAYHSLVFADLLECRRVISDNAFCKTLDEILQHMAAALAAVTHPDGQVSLFNDGGLNMAYSPAECLEVHRRLAGGAVAMPGQIHLPAVGYFGLRCGDNYFLLDCGKISPDHLPAHGHGDILAFEWDVAGKRVIVDAGVYEYAEGKWRAYARSSMAHNTVTIDDGDQCAFWKSFRVGRRARVKLRQCQYADGIFLAGGEHDGYAHLAGHPIHRRLVRTDARKVEIQDVVEGGQGQTARARLLLHPDCRVCVSGQTATISCNQLLIKMTASAPIRVESAWWCPDFGVAIPTSRLAVEYGSVPCHGEINLAVAGEVEHLGEW